MTEKEPVPVKRGIVGKLTTVFGVVIVPAVVLPSIIYLNNRQPEAPLNSNWLPDVYMWNLIKIGTEIGIPPKVTLSILVGICTLLVVDACRRAIK